MDNREILTRFKNGSLDRQSAVALLTGGPLAPPAQPAGAGSRPALDRDHEEPREPRPSEPGQTLRPAPDTADLPAAPTASDGSEGYAVIGLHGRFPAAPDLHTLWQNELDGRDTTTPAPHGREVERAEGRGHFLDAVDQFDPAFFRLTADEAAQLDPQERLFLESAWETLETAGRTGARLDSLISADGLPRSLGVFAAVSSRDYALLAAGLWTQGRIDALPAGVPCSPPDRLAELLDLSGPSQCVDAGQASFLVALHQALGALRAGECAAALVGAVELRLHPLRQVPGGGEGVCTVLLKPLAAAQADGDTVHAVVRSTAVGRGRHLDENEAGGVFHENEQTVRPAVGDAGAAAGAAALVRAIMRLREGTPTGGQDPRGAGQRSLGTDGGEPPRRATVVVRAVGGLRARAVLEEHPPPRQQTDLTEGAALVLLSAPTPEHLVATARRLADRLTGRDGAAHAVPALEAVARELRCGRAVMDSRLAVTVQDIAQLATALDDFVQDPTAAARRVRDAQPPPGLARSTGSSTMPTGSSLLDDLPETRAYLAALWHGERFEQLTRLWLAGADVTRAAVPHGPVVPLPTSAWQRRPLWIGEAVAPQRTP